MLLAGQNSKNQDQKLTKQESEGTHLHACSCNICFISVEKSSSSCPPETVWERKTYIWDRWTNQTQPKTNTSGNLIANRTKKHLWSNKTWKQTQQRQTSTSMRACTHTIKTNPRGQWISNDLSTAHHTWAKAYGNSKHVSSIPSDIVLKCKSTDSACLIWQQIQNPPKRSINSWAQVTKKKL